MKILINGLTEGIVPPRKYGGIERVNAFLVKGLQELGHDPVLLCNEGSSIDCQKMYFTPPGNPRSMLVLAEHKYGQFDIIHDNSSSGLLLDEFCETHPVFWTVHGPRVDNPLTAYLSRGSAVFGHETEEKPPPYTHLGIDLSLYSPCYDKDDDVIIFMGQVRRHKHVHYLIALAKVYNLRAMVIAPKDDSFDEAYFWENFNIRPFAWMPGADDETKCAYIRKAKCVVHCSQVNTEWCDASPMVVLESLALGTPVIGSPSGGIPEMIQHGVTGFIVENEKQAIEAFGCINQIQPAACRAYMEQYRTHTVFAKRMLVLYEQLAGLSYAKRRRKILELQPLIDGVM